MSKNEKITYMPEYEFLPSYHEFSNTWSRNLFTHVINSDEQIRAFLEDQEFGLFHSYNVFQNAWNIARKIASKNSEEINHQVVEQLSVFHDIGKFFQELHSLENISIAERVYTQFAQSTNTQNSIVSIVVDGIRSSDFYNYRLDPSGNPPQYLEGDIVRAADKMQDNLVKKVDRYWYQYGAPRNRTFFDSSISTHEREVFNFENFLGDQLNVILSIIALTPEDFSHPIIQEQYKLWSADPKKNVVERILSLAAEIGESDERITSIKSVIDWYRERYKC